MNGEDVQTILKRIDEVKRDLREDIAALKSDVGKDQERLRDNISKIFQRFDSLADLGHEVRIQELERRLNAFWTKVIGLITILSGIIGGLFQLLKGGK